MANYCFYDGSIAGTPKNPPVATPGDTSTVIIRRGWVDTTKQNINSSDNAFVFPVYAGEMILSCGVRVITAEANANADLDLGVDATDLTGNGLLTTTVNTVHHIVANGAGFWVTTNGNFLVAPNNGVLHDNGIYEVFALITKGFNSY